MNQFADRYSNAIDNFDLEKFGGFAENLAIKTQRQLFFVERKQSIVIEDTIYFSMLNMKAKTYRLEFIGQGFGQGLTGYLEDSYYNTHIPRPLQNECLKRFLFI